MADRAGFENRCAPWGTAGSNPALSVLRRDENTPDAKRQYAGLTNRRFAAQDEVQANPALSVLRRDENTPYLALSPINLFLTLKLSPQL